MGLAHFDLRFPDEPSRQATLQRLDGAGYSVGSHHTYADVRDPFGIALRFAAAQDEQ